MTMDWNMYICVVLVMGYFRWKDNKFTLVAYAKDLLILLPFVFVLSNILDFVGKKIEISLSNYLPQAVLNWMGGIIMMSIICVFSIIGWIKFNKEKSEQFGGD